MDTLFQLHICSQSARRDDQILQRCRQGQHSPRIEHLHMGMLPTTVYRSVYVLVGRYKGQLRRIPSWSSSAKFYVLGLESQMYKKPPCKYV